MSRTYNLNESAVTYYAKLTSQRQAENLRKFMDEHPGYQIEVHRIYEDPRKTWRRLRRKKWMGTHAILGRSNGCKTARGNYHSTVALLVIPAVES